jgi:hypothetical protein
MRFSASSWASTIATAAFISASAPAYAQRPPITVPHINVYEQTASKTCVQTPACRVDFGVAPKNLNVLRVSCLIALQTTQAPTLISDFELGHVSSDQNNYTLGQYLAPLVVLTTAGSDQFYSANVDTLHAVPTGYRPSILVATHINPAVPIAMQCSIHGSTD